MPQPWPTDETMIEIKKRPFPYCLSRFQTLRQPTREVKVGTVGVGGKNPIRIQSMTTTDTQEVEATVKQIVALVEAGCEIVRITAPNKKAAEALKRIRKKLDALKVCIPLVADIHFLPAAAMEAVEHVDKVRVNPGNYADKKKFNVREYTDTEYHRELERLYDAFSPLVKRARELGRSLRIGTNHGSLSDRIMNRYGDTPLGMVESALEFVRICESHGFQDIILSMKASNPKVMVQAYRLVVAKMAEENMFYPLHLGVTEAGSGEDARIKSAIGIGSLLYDGLGDTVRVSLTEDPVNEIPVARDLANRAMQLWQPESLNPSRTSDGIDPFTFNRRCITPLELGAEYHVATNTPPQVIVPSDYSITQSPSILAAVTHAETQLKDNKIEGLLLKVNRADELHSLPALQKTLHARIPFLALDLNPLIEPHSLANIHPPLTQSLMLCRRFRTEDAPALQSWMKLTSNPKIFLAIDTSAEAVEGPLGVHLQHSNKLIFTQTQPFDGLHALGSYRALAQALSDRQIRAPIWIRNTAANAINLQDDATTRLLEASMLSGGLLCDGLGDLISIETESDLVRAATLAYDVLQGARARISKTEYIACPSCGRTLFDLESTTQRVQEKTNHLKGVTIAVMGCIVNGPGEMADADFGYVGGAPGKINLYVGKKKVAVNIPEAEAVDRLIRLIQEHGKWTEP